MSWVDPERDVMVTCGSTEAMIAAMLGVLDPGDEVTALYDTDHKLLGDGDLTRRGE